MRLTAAALLATATAFPVTAQATAVTFSSAVATFHQTFDRDWSPSEMIDGITSGSNGWAIYDANTGTTEGQSSVLTLATPLAAGSYDLTFTITQNYGDVHTLGDFGLLYLTDATPTLASPTLFFTNLPVASSNDPGTTFTTTVFEEIIAGGSSPGTAVYTVRARLDSAAPVTGIFFGTYSDQGYGLPTGGPGRAFNGNFVVQELALDVAPAGVPEPATWSLLIAGFGGVGIAARRRRSAAVAA